MADIYPLTTILKNGSWGTVTEPVIIELPASFDGELSYKFFNFKRGVRVSRQIQSPKERSLGRGTESGESTEAYTIEIKSNTVEDCEDILNQIRDITIDQDYTIYSDIRVGDVEETPGRGMHYMKCPIICYRTGKTREVPV